AVAPRRGGDEGHGPLRSPGDAVRERRLAAPRASEEQHVTHQKSMPRSALMPLSKACFRLRISVTVSATSISSLGASRPVAMLFTEAGRERISATTSDEAIQPQFIGYVISSRTTSPNAPDRIFSWATLHASRAMASVRSMSCESHVKPSPIVHHSTPSRIAASRSPTFQLPDLMNCTTQTFHPRETARSIVPKAAVDFPLPSPVLTITTDLAVRAARGGATRGGAFDFIYAPAPRHAPIRSSRRP